MCEGMNMCSETSETTDIAELTHSEYPDWTHYHHCECNVTASQRLSLDLRVHLQYRTPPRSVKGKISKAYIHVVHRIN